MTPRRSSRTIAVACLFAAVALVGCGEDTPVPVADDPAGPTTSTPAPTRQASVTTTAAATTELRGTFGGNPGLEGGCAWLERPEGRYEVVWPEGYRVELTPLRLIGPSGAVVAVAGQPVTVRGRRAADRASICMVGPIFEATEVVG